MNTFAGWVFVITFPVIVNSGSDNHASAIAEQRNPLPAQQRNPLSAQQRKEFEEIRQAALKSLQTAKKNREDGLARLEEKKITLLNQNPIPVELLMRRENIIERQIQESEKLAHDLLKHLDDVQGIKRQ